MSSEANIEPTAAENVDDSPTEPEAPSEVSRKNVAGSFEKIRNKKLKNKKKSCDNHQ